MTQRRDDDSPEGGGAKKSKLERMGVPEPQKRQPETSPREGKPEQKKSKLARMGVPEPEIETPGKSPRAANPDQKQSKLARMGVPESETPRTSPRDTSPRTDSDSSNNSKHPRTDTSETIEFSIKEDASPRKFPKPIGAFIGSVLFKGRTQISETKYNNNIDSSLRGTDLSHQKLSIETSDGEKIQGIKIQPDPPSDKTIIVFQGQKGNFQSKEQMDRLVEIAQKTGTNVVAFNYRARPTSSSNLVSDAMAVTQFAMKTTKAEDITFYGESLGGAVASVTAASLKEQKNEEVNAFIARAPQSLAHASKLMDLAALTENPAVKAILIVAHAAQKIIPRNAISNLLEKHFGGDLEAYAALNKLGANKVEVIRVEGDPIITRSAEIWHDKKPSITCTTINTQAVKHEVSLPGLKPTNADQGDNALEPLRRLANPKFNLAKHLQAKDENASKSTVQSHN